MDKIKFTLFPIILIITLLSSACGKTDVNIIHDVIYLERIKNELDKNNIQYSLKGNVFEYAVEDREQVEKLISDVEKKNIRIKLFNEQTAQHVISNWSNALVDFNTIKTNDGGYVFLFARTSCSKALDGLRKYTSIPASICE